MKIVRLDSEGGFSATHRFMIVLAPRERPDTRFLGLLIELTRRRLLWLCLVVRPYVAGKVELVRVS